MNTFFCPTENKIIQSEQLVLTPYEDHYIYGRIYSDSQIQLQNLLQQTYGSKAAKVTSSGLAAISTLFNALYLKHTSDSINIIYSNELYSETSDIFISYCKYYSKNSAMTSFDPTDNESVIKLFSEEFRDQTNVLFVEACSNPHGYIFDFDLIPQLRKLSKLLYVVVDNTWLTEIIFNPADVAEIDFAVVSLTKYYSAGNAIGGAIMSFTNILSDYISMWIEIMGQHVSPINCEIIRHNMTCETDGMNSRIRSGSKLTVGIIDVLLSMNHLKLVDVIHPYNPNHISHNLAKKYFTNGLYPSVFVLVVDGIDTQIECFLDQCTKIDKKTSFGSSLSRIEPADTYERGSGSHLRFSIGYEDTADRIIGIITELLDHLAKI